MKRTRNVTSEANQISASDECECRFKEREREREKNRKRPATHSKKVKRVVEGSMMADGMEQDSTF